MPYFNPVRSLLTSRYLLLQASVVLCMAIVGCSPNQTATQEQKPQGQNQSSQTQQIATQPAPDQDEEVQMGQEVFNELKAKGEIIESSPLYDQLKPIVDPIARAAQPR